MSTDTPLITSRRVARPFTLRANILLLITIMCGAALPAAYRAWAQTSVLTQHNDNARTGANLGETRLVPTGVNATTFGKLFTRTLDANVNGQVLYVPAVTINGVVHNVIYANTSNNSDGSPCSAYAFDADDPAAANPLWRHQFTNSARWTTCTPIIDPSTKTMYVLTKDNTDTGPTNLRALDITTGNEKPGSPILISASVPGTGDGSVNGVVSFDTSHANCRPGLLLLNGRIYTAFAHNTDSFPYHGWILGYSYDQTRFTQTAVFCTNPNGGEDGIWMAGKGLSADSNNNIYCTVGNGTFDIPSSGSSYGMCILKLGTPNLNVVDWFAPFDEQGLSNQDLDLGNSGPLGIPGTNRIFAGGTKFGSVFLLDTTNMGHFTPNGPDKVVQRFNGVMSNDNVGQNPVCWDASSSKYVYLWPSGKGVLQYNYDSTAGKFNPAGIYKQAANTAGGSLTVTANGSSGGILWAVGNDHVVHAYDAVDVTRPELWNSAMNSARDGLTSVGHFQFPTVANGKVYVPSGSSSIVVYGLLPTNTTTLSPAADAYIRAGSYANTNFGTATQLICKKQTNDSSSVYNRADYLKFDLRTITTAPSKATLQLTVNSASNPTNTRENMQVYAVTDTTWTESALTWNNAPGLNRTNFSSTGTLLTTVSIPLTPGNISVDLTTFVPAHLGQVVTLQFMDATTQGIYLVLNSKEANSNRPQLVLTH